MKSQAAGGEEPILPLMAVVRRNGGAVLLPPNRSAGNALNEQDWAGAGKIVYPEPRVVRYTEAEKRFLLALARKTLRAITGPGNGLLAKVTDVPPRLTEPRACFVTLKKNDFLRGCVGNVLPEGPLYQTVAENTRSAALFDWRFPPVTVREVKHIRIGISVLTHPQPLPFNSVDDLLGKVVPYHDGVLLEIGPCRATFLPQVWQDLPDKTQFLNQLAVKAGCEPSAWKSADATILTYQVEAFEEPKR